MHVARKLEGSAGQITSDEIEFVPMKIKDDGP
jgi:hypothetical protein